MSSESSDPPSVPLPDDPPFELIPPPNQNVPEDHADDPPLSPPADSSLPHPPPNLLVLPSPIFTHDPTSYARIQDRLWGCVGLEHVDRAVLGAVLPHIPMSPDTSILDRILLLPATHLKLLANLISTGLTDARSWGGLRPRSRFSSVATTPLFAGTPLGDSQSPLLFYEPLFESLGLSALPPLTATTPASDGTSTPARRKQRSALRADNCRTRHDHRCPITLKKAALVNAHIIPYSMEELHSDHGAPFWMMLAIFLGPAVRDQVFSTLSAGTMTMNSIALCSDLHTCYDTGLFHLTPTGAVRTTFDPAVCREYDVCFRWWGSQDELDLWGTRVHQDAEAQLTSTQASANTSPRLAHALGGPIRAIVDGDVFRLFTNNPANHPLPHPLLLELHGMLWRMIAAMGMAESTKGRKRRFSEAAAQDDGDDDDDDDRSPAHNQHKGKGRKPSRHGDSMRKRLRKDTKQPDNASGKAAGETAADTVLKPTQEEEELIDYEEEDLIDYEEEDLIDYEEVSDDSPDSAATYSTVSVRSGPPSSPPPSVPAGKSAARSVGLGKLQLEYIDFQLGRYSQLQRSGSSGASETEGNCGDDCSEDASDYESGEDEACGRVKQMFGGRMASVEHAV